MRRSASEVIGNLEMRIARLEKQASKSQLKVGTYFELKAEVRGLDSSTYKTFHFLPGTILRLYKFDPIRGGYEGYKTYYQIIKLNAGSKHKIKSWHGIFQGGSLKAMNNDFIVDVGHHGILADKKYMKIVKKPKYDSDAILEALVKKSNFKSYIQDKELYLELDSDNPLGEAFLEKYEDYNEPPAYFFLKFKNGVWEFKVEIVWDFTSNKKFENQANRGKFDFKYSATGDLHKDIIKLNVLLGGRLRKMIRSI